MNTQNMRIFFKYLCVENRYHLSEEHKGLLDKIISYVANYKTSCTCEKERLYRARIIPMYHKKEFSFEDLGPPPPKLVKDGGRLNPVGISVLYLSYKKETAISETRPEIGTNLSIVEVQIPKNIKIADFSNYQQTDDKVAPILNATWLNLISKVFLYQLPTMIPTNISFPNF